MKTFLLYLFDDQLNDYQSFQLNLSYRQVRFILQQTLSSKQWEYFLNHNQCYCNPKTLNLLGYANPSATHQVFIKQITPYDYPLFICTFCFQTHCGIYFFDFKILQSQFKGKVEKILRKIQLCSYIPLNQEDRDYLLSVISPKRLTVRCINPQSIKTLLNHSFNTFVCLKHNFKHIPHIRKIINKNLCFENPFFCYWFLYITNQDGNDTKAYNILLDKSVSLLCKKYKLTEDSYHILNHSEILDFANNEVFAIGNGKIEVTLSTYDY